MLRDFHEPVLDWMRVFVWLGEFVLREYCVVVGSCIDSCIGGPGD